MTFSVPPVWPVVVGSLAAELARAAPSRGSHQWQCGTSVLVTYRRAHVGTNSVRKTAEAIQAGPFLQETSSLTLSSSTDCELTVSDTMATR